MGEGSGGEVWRWGRGQEVLYVPFLWLLFRDTSKKQNYSNHRCNVLIFLVAMDTSSFEEYHKLF